jgi:putative membrane protein
MRDTLLQLIGLVAAVAFANGYRDVDVAQDFVNRAAVSAQFEVSVADLAKERGDERTRAFAARIRREHQESRRELEKIAGEQKLAFPQQLDARHIALLESLRELRGAEFDRAFARSQVEAHHEALALFEAEATDGANPSLCEFAERSLLTLRDHLTRAEALYE